LIVLEEAAYVNPDMFYDVVVPLLGVNHTAFIAISTPKSEQNFFTLLMNLKDEKGDPFLKSLDMSLPCQACREAKLVCPPEHQAHRMPFWKSAKRQKRAALVLATDPERLDRELKGVTTTGTKYVFKEYTDRLITGPTYAFSKDVQVTYTAIDPSGGGSASDYAIATTCFEDHVRAVTNIHTHEKGG